MQITITDIHPSDKRQISAVPPGEIVEDVVTLSVNGVPMRFKVTILARPLTGFQGSIVNGEARLEELLRFEPEALSTVLSMVGKTRRGGQLEYPIFLVDRVGSGERVGEVG